MTGLSRRAVLGAAATAGVTGVAGCLEGFVEPDDETGQDDDTSGESGDDSRESTDGEDREQDAIEVVDVTVETVESNCLEDETEENDVEIEGESVAVTGVLTAPNPCYVAVPDVEVDGTTLTVDVDVESDDGDQECIQCVGVLTYEVQIELTSDGVEQVDVNHSDDGSRASTDADDEREAAPDPAVISVETLETRCATAGESVTATIENGTATVEGVTEVSNPCHEVVVTDVRVHNEELTVVVGAESTLSDDEVCQQCLGELSYEVDIDLDGADVTRVTAAHPSGERHRIDVE